MNIEIRNETIILPLPTEELVVEKEKKWRLCLPVEYKEFIMKYNGGSPAKNSFDYNNHSYAIVRFLCILKNVRENNMGWYDISVVESQIGERLTENEDLIGIEVLPIAELFAGDYLCLDFRKDKVNPTICVWNHEESSEFEPRTYLVADDFKEFLSLLY